MSDWLALVHPDDRDALMNKVRTDQQDEQSTRVISRYRVKNRAGHYLWIEATGLLVEQDGECIMVGTHKTSQKRCFLMNIWRIWAAMIAKQAYIFVINYCKTSLNWQSKDGFCLLSDRTS